MLIVWRAGGDAEGEAGANASRSTAALLVLTYAGIGSRTITAAEEACIEQVAGELAKYDYICYSGNAEGSDQAFQRGSGGRCVLFLPWPGFNGSFPAMHSVVCGDTKAGSLSVRQYHPKPAALGRHAWALMTRNYHQVFGLGEWPKVQFVLCCADQTGVVVHGGTGQAVRIANGHEIPVVNLRYPGWEEALTAVIDSRS